MAQAEDAVDARSLRGCGGSDEEAAEARGRLVAKRQKENVQEAGGASLKAQKKKMKNEK